MTDNPTIFIRKAEGKDHDAIWEIIRQVISTGDTYVFAPGSGRDKMLGYWCGKDKHCYVATIEKRVVGTLILKDNQPDLGSHVANASYMTMPGSYGKGIGSTMAEFSLDEAKRLGYRAMQFNIVVSSNDRAIQLWKRLGFKIIGKIPEAFDHKGHGLTDAYIMWKKL